MRRHELTVEAVGALEDQSRALWSASRALVECGWVGGAGHASCKAAVIQLQSDLEKLLKIPPGPIPLVVRGQVEVLRERLWEATLELDLAVTLGRSDPLGRDAMARAETAVRRDGRALLRALGFLVRDVQRPVPDQRHH